MNRFLYKKISLKSLLIGFLAISFVLAIAGSTIFVVFKDEIVTAVRSVVYYDTRKLLTKLQMQGSRIKYDFYALFDPNPNDIPEISLEVDPADLRDIDVYVKSIGNNGTLQDAVKGKRKWYPVTVKADGVRYSARIRLRGNQSTHWINQKKSWRIKFKKSNLFNRRRSIHLYIINDRMVEIEEAAIRIARELGVLVPDSGFKLVNLNGVDMGLYFWTEHFDKYQLERRRMPEGEVFLGDDAHIDKLSSVERKTGKLESFGSRPYYYKTLVHKKGDLSLNAQQRWGEFLRLLATKDREKINDRIEKFLDIDKFAKWNALLFVFASSHGQSQDNVRWFYNPTTGLFEPILRDIGLGEITNATLFQKEFYNPLVQSILMSQKVLDRRNEVLYQLVTGMDRFIISTVKDVYNHIEPYLYRGVEPIDHELDALGHLTLKQLKYTNENRTTIIARNIQNIKDDFNQSRVFGEPHFKLNEDGGELLVKMIPQGIAPVELTELELEPSIAFSKAFDEAKFSLHSSIGRSVPLRVLDKSLNQKRWKFTFDSARIPMLESGNLSPDSGETWWLTVKFHADDKLFDESGEIPAIVQPKFKNVITGTEINKNFIRFTNVAFDMPPGMPFTETKVATSPTVSTQPSVVETSYDDEQLSSFLSSTTLPFELRGQILSLPKGHYQLLESINIPNGYGLELAAGVSLSVAPNVNILVRGELILKGTEESPVKIGRLDPGSAWGAIGVISAKKISSVMHSEITGGGAGTRAFADGVYMTGQINFYGSDVNISNTYIGGSEGEDGLNIKNARFNIENTKFSGNRADAFDGDWVKGTVKNSVFIDNGNDGVDVSGSSVLVVDSLFARMGDKGISVGEQSSVDVINCRIEASNYGLVAKDLSYLRSYGSAVHDNKIGIASYRKKPLFSGGNVEIFGGLLWRNETDFVVDDVSEINVVGTGVERDVENGFVKSSDLRIGEISQIYGRSNFIVPQDELPGQFKVGPATGGKSVLGGDLPDLSKFPIGLMSPIEVKP